MAALQSVSAFVVAFSIPWVMGFPIPTAIRLIFAFLAAAMFAGGSLFFSAYLLASRLEGDHVENVFPALGRGSVNLNTAKLSRFPALLLVRLIDEQSKATVRLPRPFWSNDPTAVTEILSRVKGRR